MKIDRRALLAATAAALLAGCAVGPDFKRPEAPAADAYTREPLPAATASADVAGGNAQKLVMGADISAQWWTLFRSARLNALIDQALKNNPNVQAAQASLRQAQELVYAQQGFYYPTVQASLNSSRQRTSAALSPTLSSDDTLFNLHTAQVTVGYTLDVFGLNRRQVESLQAQANAQRFQLEAAYLTLSSNVVAAAVQEAGLRAQIAAAKDIIEINSKSLELLRRQFAAGLIAGLDVAAQEAALAQAQQALPPLQKQLEQTRNLLSALAGRFPSEGAETFDIAELGLPEELPVSLPSKLVEQRPDVRAAEEQLHAASAEVGVAVANMLPQITLNAAAGGSATVFSQMFADSNPFWSIGVNASQTLFAGGTLLHRKRAAEAALDQAGAQYRSTVITAFQNVSDTLYALQADADALRAAVNSQRAAKVSLDLVTKQLQVGQVNYLTLLSAQQTYQQAVLNLAQARTSRFADTAALFQALGGGWWNRGEVQDAASHQAGAGK
jgi:NodT family efflux transporter outer membrane factor (OMF) lipoprotein